MSRTTLQDAHKGPQMFTQFPRTLSGILETVWDRILIDFPQDDQSVDSFEATLRQFIAAHCDEEDRSDLVDQLRSVKKPRWMSVNNYRYQYQLFCSYVEWMPGHADPLTDDEMKEYLFKGFPETWQTDFKKSKTLGNETIVSVAYYMKKLERASDKAAARNTEQQRFSSRKRKAERDRSNGTPMDTKKRPTKKTNENQRIRDDDPCPLPGHAGHTWGECRSNAHNKERVAARKAAKAKMDKSKKEQAHLVQELQEFHLASDDDANASVSTMASDECKCSDTDYAYQTNDILTHCLSNAFTTISFRWSGLLLSSEGNVPSYCGNVTFFQ